MGTRSMAPASDRLPESGSPPSSEERCKVLVVDDEPKFLMSVEAVLSEHVDVVTCTSAERALKLLSASKFHLVCSDFGLPGINGTDFLEKVEALPYFVSTLLITGNEQYIRGSKANRHYVILKPFEPSRLVGLVQQLTRVARMKRSVRSLKDSAGLGGGDGGSPGSIPPAPPSTSMLKSLRDRDSDADAGGSPTPRRAR